MSSATETRVASRAVCIFETDGCCAKSIRYAYDICLSLAGAEGDFACLGGVMA